MCARSFIYKYTGRPGPGMRLWLSNVANSAQMGGRDAPQSFLVGSTLIQTRQTARLQVKNGFGLYRHASDWFHFNYFFPTTCLIYLNLFGGIVVESHHALPIESFWEPPSGGNSIGSWAKESLSSSRMTRFALSKDLLQSQLYLDPSCSLLEPKWRKVSSREISTQIRCRDIGESTQLGRTVGWFLSAFWSSPKPKLYLFKQRKRDKIDKGLEHWHMSGCYMMLHVVTLFSEIGGVTLQMTQHFWSPR